MGTRLPLGREVTVASGDTEDEPVELGEVLRGKDGVVGLGGGVHLVEDLLRQGLGNPNQGSAVSNESGR